jgi:cytochrome P450
MLMPIPVAFDIVGQLTLSRRLGFLAAGHDLDGMLAELHSEFEYRGSVQSMPLLDKFLRKNPLYLYFKSPTSFFATRSRQLLGERLQTGKKDGNVDMLDGFLEAQKKHPDVVDQVVLGSYISLNFLAGSDTTGVVMRSIIWYVLKTPRVLERLRQELDERVMVYPPDYPTAMGLSYMDAIIREAMRMHPIASIGFERVVPASGHTTPAGKRLPPGTIIAQSPWSMNFDEETWGPSPQEFKPERWLKYDHESQEQSVKRVGAMKHNDFSFSYGPRACLGKHIAWMEMVEVMPSLFGLLDVSSPPFVAKMVMENSEWVLTVMCRWRLRIRIRSGELKGLSSRDSIIWM